MAFLQNIDALKTFGTIFSLLCKIENAKMRIQSNGLTCKRHFLQFWVIKKFKYKSLKKRIKNEFGDDLFLRIF
jgi:hypothetical protein